MPLAQRLAVPLLLVLIAAAPAQAALLCEQPPCRVLLEFPNSGSIEPDQGATISFGPGGALELGSGGTIDYGVDGFAEPAAASGAAPDMSAGGRIVLGNGGSIRFGSGGRLATGDAGQIEAPDGSSLQVNSARVVDIDADASLHVGRLQTSGSLSLEAREIRANGEPAPFHFITSGDPDATLSLRSRDTIHAESLGTEGDSVYVQSSPEAGGESGSSASGVIATSGSGSQSGSADPGAGAVIVLGSGGTYDEPVYVGPNDNLSVGEGNVEIAPVPNTGTVTITSMDSDGGGAFPALLAALFLTLAYAARRPRR